MSRGSTPRNAQTAGDLGLSVQFNAETPSQVHCVISLAFLGDLQTCTFLETVLHRQSENQCFQFPRFIYVGHLGFSKWPP